METSLMHRRASLEFKTRKKQVRKPVVDVGNYGDSFYAIYPQWMGHNSPWPEIYPIGSGSKRV